MNALDKAKRIKALKIRVANASSLAGLSLAKAVKEIMAARAELGLASSKADAKGSSKKIIKGRANNVKTAKGTKVSTVLAVTEISNVIASHTASGAENSDYPQELQPRDRSRDSSQAWVQKTSRELDPESLGRSGRADTGAPITGSDLVVESGNGRIMAMQLAYKQGQAGDYKDWLVAEADYLGFDEADIEAFNEPVLIRIRTSDVDRVQFAVEANQDDKLSYSATERAKTDAKRLDGTLMQLFTPSENGDLTAASNQRFITGFLQTLGDTEAAQYMTKDGKPTQALVTRVKAAIFSKAYSDERLLEMMADQAKPELQNILNALSVAAPKFIEAQSVSRGDVQDVSSAIVDSIEESLDKQVANAIIDATNVLMTAKANNQEVAEFVRQQGLFEDLPEGVGEIAVFLATNNRSAKKIGIFFKSMAAFAEEKALYNQNLSLFDEPEAVSIKDAAEYAINEIKREYGDSANLDMFDSLNMSPLEKARAIKELKAGVDGAKASKGVNRAKAIKEIMALRKKLALGAAEPNKDTEAKLAALESKVYAKKWSSLTFDDDAFEMLFDEVTATGNQELINRLDVIAQHVEKSLVSYAHAMLASTES
jgi:hypothetical protein